MGMFSKLSEVQISEYGEKLYFEPNEYFVEIDECKMVSGDSGQFLLMSAKVCAKKKDTGIKPEVGDKAAWFQSMKVRKQIWQSSLMAFLCAIYAVEPDEYEDNEWTDIVEQVFEKNSLKGELLAFKTWNRTNDETGKTFTKFKWEGLIENDDPRWDTYECVE